MRPCPFRAFARNGLCIFGSCILAISLTACVKQTRRQLSIKTPPETLSTASSSSKININNARREELEKLPGIGPALAFRIIEHRERYGRFRRPEHLMMVRGLSDRRFRELRSQIVVE